MSEMNKPAIKIFQIYQNDSSFLGKETILTESSDFGNIWDNFFEIGGYDPILPFAIESKPINMWYTNNLGQNIYSQGFFVKDVKKAPDGYKLVGVPASDFLIVTTEWMTTNEEAVGEEGNIRCNEYAKTAQMPKGYIRNDRLDYPIALIEKENADTPNGSRYEVWIPIRKIE